MKEILEKFAEYTGGSDWLRQLRQTAWDRYVALGLPNRKQEAWRYTAIEPLAATNLTRFDHRPQLSSGSLPHGVVFDTFSNVLRSRPKLLEEHLTRYAPFADRPFVALNTASLREGTLLYIPKGVKIAETLEILYEKTSFPRILIVADAGSQVTLVERYVGPDGSEYLTDAVTEIMLGAGATVDYYQVQEESRQAFHFSHLQVQMERDAHFFSHSIDLGSRLSRNEIVAVLAGEGVECRLNGLYLADGLQHIDNQTTIDHVKAHGTSHELYKGILSDKATAVFNGAILVRPDAQKTVARQANNNLLLSDHAQINTKPLLEIHANDVKCNHGATIGRLDRTQLFYLRSRGISEAEARGLLTYAFASDVVGSIRVESLRNRLQEMLRERFASGHLRVQNGEAA